MPTFSRNEPLSKQLHMNFHLKILTGALSASSFNMKEMVQFSHKAWPCQCILRKSSAILNILH